MESSLSSPTFILSTTHQQRTPTSPSLLPTPRNSSFRYILSLSQTFLMLGPRPAMVKQENFNRKTLQCQNVFSTNFVKEIGSSPKCCRRMKFVYTLGIYTKFFSILYIHTSYKSSPSQVYVRVHRV